MRILYIFSILMLSSINLQAQDTFQVLERFDIDNHTYTFYFSRKDSDTKSFYTSDKLALKKLQQSWTASLQDKENNTMYLCGYNYNLYITTKDSIIATYNVNTKCGQAIYYTKDTSYIYNFRTFNPFRSIKPTKSVFDTTIRTKNTKETLYLLDKINKSENLFAPHFFKIYPALKYAGNFRITPFAIDSASLISQEELIQEISDSFNLEDRQVVVTLTDEKEFYYTIRCDSMFYLEYKNNPKKWKTFKLGLSDIYLWKPWEDSNPKLQIRTYLFSKSQKDLI